MLNYGQTHRPRQVDGWQRVEKLLRVVGVPHWRVNVLPALKRTAVCRPYGLNYGLNKLLVKRTAQARWMRGSASSSFCASLVRRFATEGGASDWRRESARRYTSPT